METLRGPTDNLYKFMAITGLAIFCLSVYLGYQSLEQRGKSLWIAKIDALVAQQRADFQQGWTRHVTTALEQRSNVANLEQELIGLQARQLQQELLEFNNSNRKPVEVPGDDKSKQFEELNRRHAEVVRKFSKATQSYLNNNDEAMQVIKAEFDVNMSRLAEIGSRDYPAISQRHVNLLLWGLSAMATFGVMLSYYGFRLWYLRLQRYLDARVMREATRENEAGDQGNSESKVNSEPEQQPAVQGSAEEAKLAVQEQDDPV